MAPCERHRVRDRRSSAAALLVELGLTPKLTIYLGGAPGAGKTHRLIADALGEAKAGRRVAIGWIETKRRPQLEALAAALPRIAPRHFTAGDTAVDDFDLEAALASDYETILLDELAHANPSGATHAKRWQDALALRDAGKSVLGAFNVMHLDTVAPVAERIVGHPIRELVPIAFLRKADRVIALDIAPSILESRLRTGRIVRDEDVERAAAGIFQPKNLSMMRELLLHVVDDLTIPVIAPSKVSIALAAVAGAIDAEPFLRRAAAFADALDLALETAALGGVDVERVTAATLRVDGGMIPAPPGLARGELRDVRASLLIVPRGPLADRILERPLDRDLLIVDPTGAPVRSASAGGRHPYGSALGDRLRIGYGKLTIYLGSVAGSGKTYTMLDRAHQLIDDGVDVVAALVETHGRAETAAQLAGIEQIPRLANGEIDLETLLLRHPAVALIDELAHTNLGAGARAKRYDDVIAVLRSGVDVITTLNVQHFEGVGDAVERLTGTRVRETLPDSVLEFADDVLFVDVTPDVLRQRLREGKIYPRERIDSALSNFFRTENLAALRELAVREMLRARSERRRERPFARIVLGVAPRERDVELVERAGRLARRLDVDLRVVAITAHDDPATRAAVDVLARATSAVRGSFVADMAPDAAIRIVQLLADGDVLAVESPRHPKRPLFGKPSFAVRALAAGARELLVLAPRATGAIEEDQK
ncbi:MAG: two-component system, OmpR family, sensor histidine kinase KdpD [Candidatus Eremiobacteraeota bacterium]|jgi:two-component system sensor histidine kinase KdpD|nr:two-component system, OmpR family, sensor histidine kinase KdpD [Candidatus Eremiobacteraeota bacterium]